VTEETARQTFWADCEEVNGLLIGNESTVPQTRSTSGVLRFTVSTVSYLTHYLWNP
jgi:hypothetical protein